MKKNLFVLLVVPLLLASSAGLVSARDTEPNVSSLSLNEATIIEMINQINESLLFEYHHGLMKFGPRYTGSINWSKEYSS